MLDIREQRLCTCTQLFLLESNACRHVCKVFLEAAMDWFHCGFFIFWLC
jgi:hypothetical protein